MANYPKLEIKMSILDRASCISVHDIFSAFLDAKAGGNTKNRTRLLRVLRDDLLRREEQHFNYYGECPSNKDILSMALQIVMEF